MSLSNDSLAEFQNLYSEIGRNSEISQKIFLGNVAVTAGLIGYGLDAHLGTIFLAPFAIIIPSLFFLASQLESTTRISAYIKVFFEDEYTDLNWETRWMKLRVTSLPSKRKYTLAISGLYGLLSLTCILLALKYWNQEMYWFYIDIVPIVSLVIFGVRLLVRAFSLKLCEEYISAWKKVKSMV